MASWHRTVCVCSFLVPAHLGSPGQWAIKRVCVGGTYTLFYFFTTKNCECSYVVFEQQDGRCDAMRASVLCGVGIATAPTTEHLPVHGYQLRDDVTAQLLPLTTVAWRRRQQTEKFDANGSVVTTRAATGQK